jgi:DNA anti-recombination protein RmuC
MDGLFVLAILFMLISSIVTTVNEANKKKKQNDTLSKKLDEIYTRTIKDANKANDRENKKREKVKKIGNLEKHYDEAIRDDYKERADDYFSEKSKKLDEYLSRDIKDRLRDYKAEKEEKLREENNEIIAAQNNAYSEIESEEIDGIIFTKENLARSIVIKEILDKPLALRRINE